MMNDIGPRPYLLTQNKNDGFARHGSLVFAKLVYSNDLSPAAMDDIVAQFEHAPPNCHWVLEGFGREMVRKGEDFNAYAQRGGACLRSGRHRQDAGPLPAKPGVGAAGHRRGGAALHFGKEGAPVRLQQLPRRRGVLPPRTISGRFIYRGNYERLVKIKTKYDPKNMFRYNDNVKPRAG